MECLKNCCKNFLMKKEKEQETQVITLKMPPNKEAESGDKLNEGRKGFTEDYLLSKLPPDGKEVPFILPTFKASFVQPTGPQFPNLQPGLQSSARSTYVERKADLLGTGSFAYNPESYFHQSHLSAHISPGLIRRDTGRNRNSSPLSPGWTLKPDYHGRLSSSMFDLSNIQSQKQRIDSMSSTLSSTSSAIGSIDSSLDSITLSGDEHELGKVCVRLNYQEALEQVWITLVQCSDLNLHPDGAGQQICFKAIITTPKPIQFKSTVKEYSQDISFMETFVFALRLQQLRCSALVLRLQTHNPKKRTLAESVLSLRELGPQESDHWLELNPPSKSSVCHSELHLSTCFQPVNGRIQVQILAAQNLPPSCSPLSQSFFIKMELHQLGQEVIKKKTRALKPSKGRCQWAETFHFILASLEHACSLSVRLYSCSSVRRKQCLGQVHLGVDSTLPEAVEQWKDTMSHPEKVVKAWHRLSPP